MTTKQHDEKKERTPAQIAAVERMRAAKAAKAAAPAPAPAHGLAHHAEAAAPKRGFRGRDTTVTAGERGIEPAPPEPTEMFAPLPDAEPVTAPKKAAKAPHVVPSFVVTYAEGLRVVYTFMGKGVWSVWHEAYDDTEEIYDPAFEESVPIPGYFVQGEQDLDRFGHPQPQTVGFGGVAALSGLAWVATLEETERYRGR
jgi:hypothetical protein